MTDRYAAAYQLIANGLRRAGLEGSPDDVLDALLRMPLSPATRLAIYMAGGDWFEDPYNEYRSHSLAQNPFV